MRYFLDTEFIEDGKTIELLSLGIVAEDGREFYSETPLAQFYINNPMMCPSDWVRLNVIPHLQGGNHVRSKEGLDSAINYFCDPRGFGKPEFWGYYADYDWVVFCWIFGRMIDLPEGFPMYCRDIKQLCDSMGNPKLPEQSTTEHHALADAQWNKQAFEYLQSLDPAAQTPVLEKHTSNPATQTPIQTKSHAKNEDSRDV